MQGVLEKEQTRPAVSDHAQDALALAQTPMLQTGLVLERHAPGVYAVEPVDGEPADARQAASCLLTPQPGDRVLFTKADGDTYVLAVLTRAADACAELAVPGALDTTVRTDQALNILAPAVHVQTRRFELFAHSVIQTGERLSQSFRTIFESVIDRMLSARTETTQAETRTAVITDVDSTQAGTLVQKIDGVATQNSEISMVTATQDVRLDGKRVSVG